MNEKIEQLQDKWFRIFKFDEPPIVELVPTEEVADVGGEELTDNNILKIDETLADNIEAFEKILIHGLWHAKFSEFEDDAFDLFGEDFWIIYHDVFMKHLEDYLYRRYKNE